jgi:hypothetical protein
MLRDNLPIAIHRDQALALTKDNHLINSITRCPHSKSSGNCEEEHITGLEDLAIAVSIGIRVTDFQTKRRIIDQLDVRGKLAVENEQKVVYITCKIELQPQSHIPTSHL